MAKKKGIDDRNWLKELIQEGKDRNEQIKSFPLLAERWYIDEKQPDHHQHDEYSGGTTTFEGKVSTVSPYYDNKADALKFIEENEPDKEGGTFILRHQYLRTHTKVWNEWGWI